MNNYKLPPFWLPGTILIALAACSRAPASTPSITLSTEPASTGLAGDQPQIVFHSDPNGGSDFYLMNMHGNGLIRLTENFNTEAFAAVSPDGRWLAFANRRDQSLHMVDLQVAEQSSDPVEPILVTQSAQKGSTPSWSPDSQKLAYVDDGTGHIVWLSVDGDDGSVTGNVDTGVSGFGPAWSADGASLTFFSDHEGNSEIYVMKSDGSAQTRLTDDPAPDYSPQLSPDDQHLLFISERDGNAEVYVINTDGSGLLNVSDDPAHDEFAFWSPDGTRIVYVSYQDGADPFLIGDGDAEIFIVKADGSGKTNLTANDVWDGDPAWSPDGQWISFTQRVGVQRQGHIQVIRADGSGEARLIGEPGEWNDCCSVWRP